MAGTCATPSPRASCGRATAAAARSGELLPAAAIQLAILGVVTGGGTHPWLAVLPFASAATFGLFFSQLRGIAEHAAEAGGAMAGHVRSHAPHWLDRVLLYDLNFNYHRDTTSTRTAQAAISRR